MSNDESGPGKVRFPNRSGEQADGKEQTDGDRTHDGGRTRATSSEWRQYHERADRIRARVGDPFPLVIERRERRRRLFRAGMMVVAVAAMIALSGGMLWLLLEGHLESLIRTPSD